MDTVKKIADAFKPYHGKAMALGACILAGHLALKVMHYTRKVNLYSLKLIDVNVLPFTSQSKDPWAIIIFEQGDGKELKALCERLVFLGISVYVLTTPKQQGLIDSIQGELVRTTVKFRYSFRLFDEFDRPAIWEDLDSELKGIDARVLYNFGGISGLGWRSFEDRKKQIEETRGVVAQRYVLPMTLLAFAKNGKGGRRLVVQIENKDDQDLNNVDDSLLNGVGRELLEDGIELRKVVTPINYLML